MSRVGEENINKYGNKMVIVEYINANDITVLFDKYNFRVHTAYKCFKSGGVKCPYDRRYHNLGYIGVGKYKPFIKGKSTKQFDVWSAMMTRCYSSNKTKRSITYEGCTVCDEWHNFQNFAEWFEQNYYEVDNEEMCLDKDILIKGNKVYSPDTCVFVTQKINKLFVKSNRARGDLPIGVSWSKEANKFRATCSYTNSLGEVKQKHLGLFTSIDDAFCSYKSFKEDNIQRVATEYDEKIPKGLYVALVNYKVEKGD